MSNSTREDPRKLLAVQINEASAQRIGMLKDRYILRERQQ